MAVLRQPDLASRRGMITGTKCVLVLGTCWLMADSDCIAALLHCDRVWHLWQRTCGQLQWH